MASMISAAKKSHAESIAKKLNKNKVGDSLYRGYVKDLQKLNYTTLVVLSPKIK